MGTACGATVCAAGAQLAVAEFDSSRDSEVVPGQGPIADTPVDMALQVKFALEPAEQVGQASGANSAPAVGGQVGGSPQLAVQVLDLA